MVDMGNGWSIGLQYAHKEILIIDLLDSLIQQAQCSPLDRKATMDTYFDRGVRLRCTASTTQAYTDVNDNMKRKAVKLAYLFSIDRVAGLATQIIRPLAGLLA